MQADSVQAVAGKNHPLVYVIVLNWNGYKDTVDCLSSLFEMDYPNCRIVVIDNGSVDGSPAKLQQFADRITLLRSEVNLGYTGGSNLGIRHALENGAEWVWLLNNDTVVPSDALTKLVAGAIERQIDIASPVISVASQPERVWASSGIVDIASCTFQLPVDIDVSREWQRQQPERIAVLGTAMFIHRRVIEAVGILDDRFFAYWEDVDYCIRGARAGFRIATVFESEIYHKKTLQMQTGFKEKPHYYYLMTRNELLLWKKYASGLRRAKMFLRHFRRVLWSIEQMAAYPDGKQACLAGAWDGWRSVTGKFDPARRMPLLPRTLIISLSRIIARIRPWRTASFLRRA